jgi:flagellar motor switch/type III secretory pathway protein FliN
LDNVRYNKHIHKQGAKQMLTETQKADKLREAIALLMDVDCLVQAALGDTDVCYDTHCQIEELIDELQADVMDLDARAEGVL